MVDPSVQIVQGREPSVDELDHSLIPKPDATELTQPKAIDVVNGGSEPIFIADSQRRRTITDPRQIAAIWKPAVKSIVGPRLDEDVLPGDEPVLTHEAQLRFHLSYFLHLTLGKGKKSLSLHLEKESVAFRYYPPGEDGSKPWVSVSVEESADPPELFSEESFKWYSRALQTCLLFSKLCEEISYKNEIHYEFPERLITIVERVYAQFSDHLTELGRTAYQKLVTYFERHNNNPLQRRVALFVYYKLIDPLRRSIKAYLNFFDQPIFSNFARHVSQTNERIRITLQNVHDMNNHLTVLIGYLTIWPDTIRETGQPLTYAEDVRSEFSVLLPAPKRLSLLLQRLKADRQEDAETHKVELIFNFPAAVSHLRLHDLIHAQVLLRALNNFISNGIKFRRTSDRSSSGAAGELSDTIQPYVRVQTFETSDEQMVVMVQDDGRGMSDEFLTHGYFEFAERAEDVIADEILGSGIGVTSAMSITESIGGRVYVHSALGRGTTVFVTIPLSLFRKGTAEEMAAEADHEVSEPDPVIQKFHHYRAMEQLLPRFRMTPHPDYANLMEPLFVFSRDGEDVEFYAQLREGILVVEQRVGYPVESSDLLSFYHTWTQSNESALSFVGGIRQIRVISTSGSVFTFEMEGDRLALSEQKDTRALERAGLKPRASTNVRTSTKFQASSPVVEKPAGGSEKLATDLPQYSTVPPREPKVQDSRSYQIHSSHQPSTLITGGLAIGKQFVHDDIIRQEIVEGNVVRVERLEGKIATTRKPKADEKTKNEGRLLALLSRTKEPASLPHRLRRAGEIRQSAEHFLRSRGYARFIPSLRNKMKRDPKFARTFQKMSYQQKTRAVRQLTRQSSGPSFQQNAAKAMHFGSLMTVRTPVMNMVKVGMIL